MIDITYSEYWAEIKSLTEQIATEAMEQAKDEDYPEEEDSFPIHERRLAAEEIINDTLLHETIDSHQWVIYYSYNLDVIKHSGNSEYMSDNFGSEYAGDILADKGIDDLHTVIAFWCMYADVQDNIESALDAIEQNE